MNLVGSIIWLSGGVIWFINGINNPEYWWCWVLACISLYMSIYLAKSFDKQINK